MDIAVIGAGIGGLAFATLAARRGMRCVLFDKFDKPAPVGSGLVIQPVGQAVLQELGQLQSALQAGSRITRILGQEKPKNTPVLDVRYNISNNGFGLGMNRSTLFDLLFAAAQNAGVEIAAAHEAVGREGQRILFRDGRRSARFALIVDASGAQSKLSPIVRRALPFGALWGHVPWPEASTLVTDFLTQAYRRASNMIGVLSVGQIPGLPGRHAAIFWSLPADGYDNWKTRGLQAWQAEASELWPEFSPFAAQITQPEQLTMARYAHGSLRRPVADGIAYIGDAAHQASPQLGQGANMALLDALALCRALERSRRDVPLALRYYALSRRANMAMYQLLSRIFTPQYQSHSRVLPWMRNHVFYPLSQTPPASKLLSHVVCGTLLNPLGSLQ